MSAPLVGQGRTWWSQLRRKWGPVAQEETRQWRAVAVFRLFTFVYALALYAHAYHAYARPWVGWLAMAVMGVWTAIWLRLRRPNRRWLVADLAMCAASVLVTLMCDTEQRILGHEQTLPTVWSATAVLGWAVWAGWSGGAFAAAVIAIADLVEVRSGLSLSTLDSIVLLFLAGAITGYCLDLFRAGRRDMAAAAAVAAAARERERLAADIHDSVLQVLAYARWRGEAMGGEAAQIGRLAGQQEARLRTLMVPGEPQHPGERQDVAHRLAELGDDRVTVSVPAGPVLLEAAAAEATVAAVLAALDNVRCHAGPAARSWILVEDDGADVVVTVRDDGAGFAEGRLAEALSEGRLGVAASIRGRVEAIGGTVTVESRRSRGTEVTLRVPAPLPAVRR